MKNPIIVKDDDKFQKFIGETKSLIETYTKRIITLKKMLNEMKKELVIARLEQMPSSFRLSMG